MSLLIAALTGWNKLLAGAAGGLIAIAFALFLPKLVRAAISVLWKLLPNGRLKYALFKERSRPDQSLIDPSAPWVQAQWVKNPQQRTNRITAPPEFIPGERVDQPRSGTHQQGPESRR